jgi:CheY-like chemotaxis protein
MDRLGHAVTVAEDGLTGLSLLEERRFDLVLMDIQLPELSGDEILARLRRREEGSERRQPVIALTAYAMRGERQRFLAAGFDGYVAKPVIVEELVAEMERVMAAADAAPADGEEKM